MNAYRDIIILFIILLRAISARDKMALIIWRIIWAMAWCWIFGIFLSTAYWREAYSFICSSSLRWKSPSMNLPPISFQNSPPLVRFAFQSPISDSALTFLDSWSNADYIHLRQAIHFSWVRASRETAGEHRHGYHFPAPLGAYEFGYPSWAVAPQEERFRAAWFSW